MVNYYAGINSAHSVIMLMAKEWLVQDKCIFSYTDCKYVTNGIRVKINLSLQCNKI